MKNIQPVAKYLLVDSRLLLIGCFLDDFKSNIKI